MPAFEALRGMKRSVRKREEQKEEKEWQEKQKSRHPCFRTKVPLRILKDAWLYRIVYTCLVGIVFLLVRSVPKTFAIDSEGDLKEGSDPGYVEILEDETIEEKRLLEGGESTVDASEDRGRRGRRRSRRSDREVGAPEVQDSSERDRQDRENDSGFSPKNMDYEAAPNAGYSGIRREEYSSSDEESRDSEYELYSDDDYEIDLEPDEGLDSRLSGVPLSEIPIRTKYCRQSKKFVAKYDHFCGIIGTCIGERNHFRFWLFLLGNTALICYSITVVHSGFYDTTAKFEVWMQENGHALAVSLVLWFLLLVVGGLFVFHCFLLMGNLTSYEFMRTEKISYLVGTKDFDLPFSRGLFTNLKNCVVQDGAISMLLRREWKPITYKKEPIIRDSENIFDNIWENKYYSCC